MSQFFPLIIITMLRSNEHLEPLGSGHNIIVSDIHHFNTDTILLADFASAKAVKNAVELGAGCGTISVLLKKNNKAESITAVELQPDACDMLTRTVQLNSIQGLTVLNADLNLLRGQLPFGFFDLVVCNPPYKETGTGLTNPHEGKMTARHETSCTLEDVIRSAGALLNFGGRFCMCQRPERLTDAVYLMRDCGLEPKRLRLVQQRVGKPPKLFLIEGRRGGKRGFMTVEPTLLIEAPNGDFSDEMLRIYGDYKC